MCPAEAPLFERLIDSHPRCFPTDRPLDRDMRLRLAVHGRRYELSLLNIIIEECGCCGIIMPVQDDPWLGDGSFARDPITKEPSKCRRQHLSLKFHDAFRCRCDSFCKGEQFFSKGRPNHIAIFKQHHAGVHPSSALEAGTPSLSLVRLCNDCHEVRQNNKDLKLARPFSFRNGFGRPMPVAPAVNDRPNRALTDKAALVKELDNLLLSFTAAEESAVRQVSPLVSLARLRHGNIGSKGNVTCVHQNSTWQHVLPNLPSECHTIRVKYKKHRNHRSSEGNSTMASFEFQRSKIQRFCELVELLRPPGYHDVTYDRQRLAQWPVQGNLLNITASLDTDDGETEEGPEDPVPQVGPNIRVTDEGDMGPAPLQNSIQQDEEFSAFIGQADQCTNSLEDSVNGVAQTAMLVDTLRYHASNADGPTAPPPVDPLTVDPLRYLTLHNNDTRADTCQTDAMPVNGFVNMQRDPYAWTRAFPKIFRPTLMPDGVLAVQGDITKWFKHREAFAPSHQWHKWLMWRGDGAPAAHPTFALVVFNETQRAQLRNQGKYALKISDSVDDTTTIQDFLSHLDNDVPGSANTSTVDKVQRSLNYHAGNVRGTDQYWGNVLRQWQATALFHSIINDREATYFHSGSIAENHDPLLRRLLSQYVSRVESQEAGARVLVDDKAFFLAANRYKQVVTHYFACKTETWFATFLVPVLLLLDYMRANEFAKSRGAIHFHSVLYTASKQDASLNAVLHHLAMTMHEALQELNDFLVGQGDEPGPIHDGNLPPKEAFQAASDFLSNHPDPEFQSVHDTYQSTLKEAFATATASVTDVLVGELGYSATHPGVCPSEWLEPMGRQAIGYSGDSAGMAKKKYVMEQAELKKHKFEREDNLYDRRVNMINHCWCHRCSDYCLREETVAFRYNPTIHTDTAKWKPFEIKLSDGTPVKMVKGTVKNCRCGFNRQLQFGRGTDKDRTGGIEPNDKPRLEFDGNGVPKLIPRRNKHNMVEEPLLAFHFAANCDFRRFLHDCTPLNQDEFFAASQEAVWDTLHANGCEGTHL